MVGAGRVVASRSGGSTTSSTTGSTTRDVATNERGRVASSPGQCSARDGSWCPLRGSQHSCVLPSPGKRGLCRLLPAAAMPACRRGPARPARCCRRPPPTPTRRLTARSSARAARPSGRPRRRRLTTRCPEQARLSGRICWRPFARRSRLSGGHVIAGSPQSTPIACTCKPAAAAAPLFCCFLAAVGLLALFCLCGCTHRSPPSLSFLWSA